MSRDRQFLYVLCLSFKIFNFFPFPRARSTAYLYIIMTVNWIFEIISFYIHTSDASLVLFDILNALQGIVIFIIFVSLPQPLGVIKRWWRDRGSFEVVRATEMHTLNGEKGAAKLAVIDDDDEEDLVEKEDFTVLKA